MIDFQFEHKQQYEHLIHTQIISIIEEQQLQYLMEVFEECVFSIEHCQIEKLPSFQELWSDNLQWKDENIFLVNLTEYTLRQVDFRHCITWIEI